MNMKQSCKALICAIEGELDGRHCTEEQAAAILDHALPSLTEALALAEAERDRYKAAWMEFMDRTDWMQEKGQVPAKYLAQHRADVLTAMLNEARAALATQPAAGEQIYQLRNPKIGPEWHEVDQVAYDEFSSMPAYERRTLWTAPPAAAHGDEAVQYRLLRVGEVIKATDELLMDDCITWHRMGDGPQIGIGWGWHAGLMPVRRIDAAMRAQGEGGEA